MSFREVAFGDEGARLDFAVLTKEVKSIQEKLNKAVIGQEKAVNTVASGLFSAVVNSHGVSRRKKPLATFVFVGPSGVGKTFLAENLAQAIGVPYKRFDMSAYAGKEANVEFSGSDRVYKESKEGNVTSFVYNNPQCVLIFDEIEKAHPVVINLFLQILDNGVLRDSNTDYNVSFEDTVIIFTTNAGRQIYETAESADASMISRKTVLKALEKDVNPLTGQPYFPLSICSRFASGNVIAFNRLDAYSLYRITRNQVKKCCERLEGAIGLTVDESVFSAFLFSEGGSADARVLTSKVSDFFNDEIFELFRLMTAEDIGKLESVRLCTELDGSSDEARAFFEKKNMNPILVLASEEVCEACRRASPGVTFELAADHTSAADMIRGGSWSAVLADVSYGVRNGDSDLLNAEDVDSEARDLMWFVKVNRPELPFYLLVSDASVLGDEERVSLSANGVKGIITLDKDFSGEIVKISDRIHCIEGMNTLARGNKLLSYETLQSLSEDKRTAAVTLFDFELERALDPDDKESVLSVMSQPNVTFDDVCGAEEAKKELCYFAKYLKNYAKYNRRGAGVPRGILLYGPSGTGKTMLAKAMAKETGATFISADANSFIKGNASMGIRRVHEIFATARRYAPSVIFVDEFDAIAKERVGARDGTEETLTAFLTEMDGFSTDRTKPVFVLAATNFSVKSGSSKSIDSAVLRRFDRRIYVGLPDRPARAEFIERKIAEGNGIYCISEGQKRNTVLRSTGMSLAELDSVFEMAVRWVVEDGEVKVDDEILNEAFESFNMGERKEWSSSQLQRVARHEAGHALMSFAHGEIPLYVSVVARGGCCGYIQYADSEDKAIYTKKELLARIEIALGGRGAEVLCYGGDDGLSTGSADDIAHATELAESMVCSFGMFEDVGMATLKDSDGGRRRINEILEHALENVKRTIDTNKERFDALVKALMDKNSLCADELQEILKK